MYLIRWGAELLYLFMTGVARLPMATLTFVLQTYLWCLWRLLPVIVFLRVAGPHDLPTVNAEKPTEASGGDSTERNIQCSDARMQARRRWLFKEPCSTLPNLREGGGRASNWMRHVGLISSNLRTPTRLLLYANFFFFRRA